MPEPREAGLRGAEVLQYQDWIGRSEAHTEEIAAGPLCANPQVMAFSDFYQGLQTRVVDGTEHTPSNIYTQKMHEVQKYLTVSEHGDIGYAVITDRESWETLPADIRTIREGAMRDATRYANAISQQDNEEAAGGPRPDRGDPQGSGGAR